MVTFSGWDGIPSEAPRVSLKNFAMFLKLPQAFCSRFPDCLPRVKCFAKNSTQHKNPAKAEYYLSVWLTGIV